tara:strand:+ start:1749 stop:2171 length:423 start_codon:yes stop_codon:yes gene_type:complete
MPLPKPNEDETKDGFISRCIEDNKAKEEFPNLTQRIAVCVSQWDRKDEIQNAPKVRKNADCPDGWEHEMPDGSFMCGKKHGQTKKEKKPYGNEINYDHALQFTQQQMDELHENGVLYITQTDEDGSEMVLKFTYQKTNNE